MNFGPQTAKTGPEFSPSDSYASFFITALRTHTSENRTQPNFTTRKQRRF